MKMRIVLICALVLCIGVSVFSTVAFFTAEDTARNVITAGSLDIEVIEEQKNEAGEIVPYPEEAIQVLPGVTVSKIVSVKNKDADAYIRIKLEVAVKDAEGNALDVDGAVLTVSSNEMWQAREEDDGWLYYNGSVKTGEITLPVIDGVEFLPEMGDEFQGAVAEINVIAQAVQTANNGEDVFKAQGWPEEK
ncbi:MAG: hypothetical protein IJA55_05125 [Clostridia bacterium]|nr:hypothetical protein [Clostridia bacterium]